MGALRDAGTGQVSTLSARTLIGRSRDCALRVDDPNVSAEHATIWWSDDRGWCLRDLGSTNGTTVDGRALGVGEVAELRAGAVVELGGTSRWALVHDEPPVAVAVAESGHRIRARHDLLALPDAEEPLVTIYARRDGSWALSRDADTVDVEDGAEVEVGGERWTLRLPSVLPETLRSVGAPPTIDDVALQFVVSRDEEFVELRVDVRGETHLLAPRVFHYMLLILARARLGDEQVDDAARGWIDGGDLARGLRVNGTLLNLHIWRARRQLEELGIRHAGDLVARQGRTGLLRIGVGRLAIVQAGD